MTQADFPPAGRPPAAGRNPDRKGPVFGIGFGKTATTSLYKALTWLGYRSCHWRSDTFSDETRQLIEAGSPLPFEAYTNVASVMDSYAMLDRTFPSAVFILTVRDLADWLASMTRHVTYNRGLNDSAVRPRHTWVDVDPVGWRSQRILHHEAVFRYFKDRPDKLLVLDIPAGDGWPSLCRFLNCAQPAVRFPHVDPLAVWAPKAKPG